MTNNEEKRKQVNIVMTGVVVSDKADKTITVNVERRVQHPVYKKTVKKRKKYLVHDENNQGKTGDVVKIQLVRPISKLKRWKLVDVLVKGPEKEVTK